MFIINPYIFNLGTISSHPTLTTWLVSYWRADTNGSFPDAHWSNTWTISWASYTSSWKVDWAYSYNWTTDYVGLSNITPWTTFSISSWIYLDALWNYRWIIWSTTTTGAGFHFQLSTSDYPNIYLYWVAAWITSSVAITTGTWYNVIATYDGSNIRIYLNWVLRWTQAASGSCTTTTSLQIWQTYINRWFDWKIDETWYWSKTLTQAEITSLYNWWSWLSYN